MDRWSDGVRVRGTMKISDQIMSQKTIPGKLGQWYRMGIHLVLVVIRLVGKHMCSHIVTGQQH